MPDPTDDQTVHEAIEEASATPPNPMDAEDEPAVSLGPITILPDKFEVFLQNRRVHLTLTEYRLLLMLLRRPGWTFSAEQIRQALGNKPSGSREVAVKTHIYTLRQKLGDARQMLETVRGMGYRIASRDADAGPSDGPKES